VAVVAAAMLALGFGSAGYLASPAFAQDVPKPKVPESAVAKQARQTPLVKDTPCTITAKACVDLDEKKAWLIDKGVISRGPVDITSGGEGKETPTGHALTVYRKEPMHLSSESRGPDGLPSKMPWSVFFEQGGIAFHGGDLNRDSLGCIHLSEADAKAWFDYLKVGDQVQVLYGHEEMDSREGKIDPAKDRNIDTDPKDDPR